MIENITTDFIYNNGKEIDPALLNDLVSDCGKMAEDEAILQDNLLNHTYFPCPKEDQIPCRSGHSTCFSVTEICVYKLNSFNYLIPCRTRGHLQECQAYECNLKYKCPDSCCISFGYTCDGKWDCPHGYDGYEMVLYTAMRQCKTYFIVLEVTFVFSLKKFAMMLLIAL